MLWEETWGSVLAVQLTSSVELQLLALDPPLEREKNLEISCDSFLAASASICCFLLGLVLLTELSSRAAFVSGLVCCSFFSGRTTTASALSHTALVARFFFWKTVDFVSSSRLQLLLSCFFGQSSFLTSFVSLSSWIFSSSEAVWNKPDFFGKPAPTRLGLN